MKYQILLFSCFLLLFLNTSCEKAEKIHLISAHTWVVTSVPNGSNFAGVGDELTFYDNRLFFNNSNGLEIDGRWDFEVTEVGFGAGTTSRVEGLFVNVGFGTYDFTITTLTDKELVLSNNSSNFGSFVINLKAKE